MNAFHFFSPTEIRFGEGCLHTLAEAVAPLGAAPLIVCGRSSARATGLLDQITALLPSARIFEGVQENPGTAICETIAAECLAQNRDLIIAVGGGSVLDAAKAAAGLARNPGACADFFGTDTFTAGALPIVTIPTTAGTGSEVTPYAVLTSEAENTKRTIGGRALFPKLAMLDPTLTVSLPKTYTAWTGLDVLSQAMEGYVSRKATPLTDALALECSRIVYEALPEVVANGDDIEARGRMLYASALSGIIISHTGTTLVHGMGYYYTLHCGVAHGLANALLLAPVFQYNARHLPEKVARLAACLGSEAKAEGIGQALRRFLEAMAISPAASEAGVEENQLDAFAESIFPDTYRFKNQVGEPSLEEVRQFFQQSFDGSPQ